MGKKDTYAIRSSRLCDTAYEVSKLDEDLNLQETYLVSEIGGQGSGSLVCTCFAGAKNCRHQKMLRKFQAEDRIDSGWRYSFDKDKWFPPINVEAVD